MRLVALIFLFASSAQSWGHESLLVKCANHGASEIHSAVFQTNTSRRYEIRECKSHALTISAWIWLSNHKAVFLPQMTPFSMGWFLVWSAQRMEGLNV